MGWYKDETWVNGSGQEDTQNIQTPLFQLLLGPVASSADYKNKTFCTCLRFRCCWWPTGAQCAGSLQIFYNLLSSLGGAVAHLSFTRALLASTGGSRQALMAPAAAQVICPAYATMFGNCTFETVLPRKKRHLCPKTTSDKAPQQL